MGVGVYVCVYVYMCVIVVHNIIYHYMNVLYDRYIA